MKQTAVKAASSLWKAESLDAFSGSVFNRIGKEWMLITATDGSDTGWNTMTASWGGFGVLWNKNVGICFVRESRHTFPVVNAAPVFTLSFFGAEYRKALSICGEKSGRDTDKAAAAGLTPIVFGEGPGKGGVGFEEASEVFVCKKLYMRDFDPSLFLDPAIDAKNYGGSDYHRVYIGEILAMMKQKK